MNANLFLAKYLNKLIDGILKECFRVRHGRMHHSDAEAEGNPPFPKNKLLYFHVKSHKKALLVFFWATHKIEHNFFSAIEMHRKFYQMYFRKIYSMERAVKRPCLLPFGSCPKLQIYFWMLGSYIELLKAN